MNLVFWNFALLVKVALGDLLLLPVHHRQGALEVVLVVVDLAAEALEEAQVELWMEVHLEEALAALSHEILQAHQVVAWAALPHPSMVHSSPTSLMLPFFSWNHLCLLHHL
jgi:hypothetical protein